MPSHVNESSHIYTTNEEKNVPKCQSMIKHTNKQKAKEKKILFPKGEKKKQQSDFLAFSSATLYTRKQQINVFKASGKNNFVLRILHISKEVKCEYKFNIC